MKSSWSWSSALAGAVGLLILLLAIALLIVLTGSYNFSARNSHIPLVGWAIDTTMHNSVQRRAPELKGTISLAETDLDAGAGEYKTMCQHCHGGVGVKPAEWTRGMRPNPPPLAKAAEEWKPGEIFWIVKNGIKMTGMPAFGASHDDRVIWNIAAFVKALPKMDAQQYAAYRSGHGDAEEASADGHSHVR